MIDRNVAVMCCCTVAVYQARGRAPVCSVAGRRARTYWVYHSMDPYPCPCLVHVQHQEIERNHRCPTTFYEKKSTKPLTSTPVYSSTGTLILLASARSHERSHDDAPAARQIRNTRNWQLPTPEKR